MFAIIQFKHFWRVGLTECFRIFHVSRRQFKYGLSDCCDDFIGKKEPKADLILFLRMYCFLFINHSVYDFFKLIQLMYNISE